MKKYVTNKDSICPRCKKGHFIAQLGSGPWYGCNDISLGGANKGRRRQCRAFEPKDE